MVYIFFRGLNAKLTSLKSLPVRTFAKKAGKAGKCADTKCSGAFTSSQCKNKSKKKDCKKKGKLHNKVALITGGSQGIGRAIAKEMLKNGIRGITIADNAKAKGCETIKELTCEFGEDKIIFIECDVANCNSVDWAFKKTLQFHDDINIVVNNAGIMNDIKWDRQINVNAGGCLIGSLLGMQYMAKSCNGAGGIVINVASIIGLIPSSGCPVHTMTQHAIVGFSRALGYPTHFRRTGVKIIAYCPGLTKTKILTEAKKNAINENFAKEFADEIEDCEFQKPSSVAKGIVSIMDKAASGTVWVSECDEPPFEVKFPSIHDLKPKSKKKCKPKKAPKNKCKSKKSPKDKYKPKRKPKKC